MSRKYTSWASNQLSINPDLSAMMRLSTVSGNEQDQLKNFERVEAIPHMYINVDAPPPPTTKFDGRAIQPTLIQNSQASYFAAPNVMVPPSNVQTKIWPIEKPAKNTSIFESGSSTSKRPHKHKHHHHHHGEKHHHHRHHSRRHRAKSAESIRNRQHPSSLSTSKLMLANSQYLDQDQQQQQQQQQPMIVYREVANGDGYSVDPNTFASVPYGTETAVADDQQAPMVVYRDANFSQPQQHQSVISDGLSQDIFYNQDQDGNIGKQPISLQPVVNKLVSQRIAPVNETQVNSYPPYICSQPSVSTCSNVNYIQEIERIYIEEDCCPPLTAVRCVSDPCVIQQTADPFFCLPQQQQQQQSSQIVYCTDSNQQDYMCASNNNNIIQQVVTPQQHQQQQFVCVDNPSSTMQPTIINQIPVFNPLATAQSSQSIISMPQTSLQRATSVLIQQQPQHQPLQIIQQPQPLQVIQQPQPLQLIQQPQQLQFIPNQQAQTGQYLQIASATPQIIQTIQPQIIQNPSVLQTIQVPAQTVAASPQILYQRPYDPVMVPIQNQQLAIANSPVVSLSQPSYAPARIASTLAGGQSQGPNMFRHALLQTVAGRTGVPLPAAQPVSGGGAIQLMQPTVTSPIASNANFILGGNVERSSSLPIVPLTPGGLLIPFQPSQTSGIRSGPFAQAGAHSNLRNFNDIRQHIQQQRALIAKNLQQQQQRIGRIPSPPVISAAPGAQRGPYVPGNAYSSAGSNRNSFPSGPASTYAQPLSTGPNYSRQNSVGFPYSQGSYTGSNTGSVGLSPYRSIR